MAIERNTFLEVLKDAYSAYYTLVPAEEDTDLPLSFRAEYKSRDESYFFVKSASIWGNEKNEYAYVFSAESLDPELANRCMDWALQDMLPKVKPHKEHQYTNAKVVFIVDSLDKETIRTVQKKRFSKSYGLLSVHGYTELIAVAVVSSASSVSAKEGSDVIPKRRS